MKKLYYIIPFSLLISGIAFSQDLKKVKKAEKSEQENTKSVELKKEERTNKEVLVVTNNSGNENQEENNSGNTSLSKKKVIVLDELKSSFEAINSKKENVKNWSQLEARYLAHINQELEDYPFEELKLSTQDADFRQWVKDADDIVDLRLFSRIMKQLNGSI